MTDTIDDGMYIVCPNPNCRHVHSKGHEDYQFLDVHEDAWGGRDVIKFVCGKCKQTGESFVFIAPN